MKREYYTYAVVAAVLYFGYRWYRAGGRLQRGSIWPWSPLSLMTPAENAPLSDGVVISQGH